MDRQRITQLRQSLGLSQVQFASRLGVERSVLSRIESGERSPSSRFLAACKAAFPELELSRGPNRRSCKPLRSERRWVRRVFPRDEPPPCPPLRMAFALARYTAAGRSLVESLDHCSHPSIVWTAIKTLAGQMNGPEQLFLLHGLANRGKIQEVTPQETCFQLPVLLAPGHWPLALLVNRGLFFPQVTVAVNGRNPRLDFLVALPGTPPLFIDLEIDGPRHALTLEKDRSRAMALGLPELRIPSQQLERPEFWKSFCEQLRVLVTQCGREWTPGAARLKSLS